MTATTTAAYEVRYCPIVKKTRQPVVVVTFETNEQMEAFLANLERKTNEVMRIVRPR